MNINDLLSSNFDLNTSEKFYEIAEIILNQSLLVVGNAYRITDIEFYWMGKEHKDGSTYNRKHTEKLPTGSLFIHYSGVDIALDNECGYGGILIRGLLDINTHQMYSGPLVCSMKLLSGHIVLNGTGLSAQLKTFKLDKIEIYQGPRKGIGENGHEGGFHERPYRFYFKPGEIRKVYPKNKITI